MHCCEVCGKSFNRSFNLRRHQTSAHGGQKSDFICHLCEKQFSRRELLQRHADCVHLKTSAFACGTCEKTFSRKDKFQEHVKSHEKKRRITEDGQPYPVKKIRSDDGPVHVAQPSTDGAHYKESAFRGRMSTWRIKNEGNEIDLDTYLESKRETVVKLIREGLLKNELKCNVKIFLVYIKDTDGKTISQDVSFKTKNEIIYISTNLNLYYDGVIGKLKKEAEDFEMKDSGWSLEGIIEMEVRLNKFNPLRGSSYIELPDVVKKKHAIINVKNNDNMCFKWSVLSALHPCHNSDRVVSYEPYADELDFTGIAFPVRLTDVPKFEQLNDISVNVYALDENNNWKVFPLLVTQELRKRHVDLLFLKNKNANHFCLIKSLSRLLFSQLSSHGHTHFVCRRCLCFYYSQDSLNQHEGLCSMHEAVRVKLPTEESKCIRFKNFNHGLRVPFVCYADFECMTVKINTCQPDPSASFTMAYEKHVPMSFSYYITFNDKFYKPPVVYRGADAAQKFVQMLVKEAEEIERIYSVVVPMTPLTPKEQKAYDEAKSCHLCGGCFTPANPKCHDHDHITSSYRMPLCNSCNLNFKNPRYLPIYFHNLSAYDAHVFVKELGFDERPIDLIPNSEEKYISFSKVVGKNFKLRFLDSFRFMPSSLESLVSNMEKSQFKHTQMHCSADKVDLMMRKGVYPYDYIDDLKKCDETELPPKEKFYNVLNERGISDADYAHAHRVWETFGITTLGEYSDLYVKTDVLLLADVFENFRDICLKTYTLDPAWYFTAPGLSWDAMLKTTRAEIELLTDYDMLLFVESGIRGGISQCSHRYSAANNKYMASYDPGKESKYLMYFDINSMYGATMRMPLPLCNFAWCEPLDVQNIPDDSPVGYLFEVDLKYDSEEVQDRHSDLPMAPENRKPPGSRETRLLTTLYDKKNYIIHYRNLKQCLEHGLVLEKVHRVLKFDQSPWMKPYIDLNTEMRTTAKNAFEKNFYKLMINSVFGKTMENIRNRVDIRLSTTVEQTEKLIAKPNFNYRTIFAENLAAIHMRRTSLTFNKPIAIGMAILDVSKTVRDGFHYEVMKEKYGEKVKLMYTDTDSLIYEVRTDDIYEDMKSSIDKFDTAEYPEDNIYGMPRVNKKIPGKMKDENQGKIMKSFVGLRAKVYSYEMESGDGYRRLKGVKKQAIEDKICHQNYEDCLLSNHDMSTTFNLIRSRKHELFSVRLNKLALCPKDAKRHILSDGISTLAFGHYSIQ